MTHTMAFALTRDPALGAVADGGVTKLGTGTLSLTSAASDFTGPVNVEGGTLAFAPKMTNDVTVAQGATLSVSGTASVGRVAGAGTVAGGTLEIHGTMAVGTTKVTGALTVRPKVVVDFGRTAPATAAAGTRIALMDVSEATALSLPASVAVTGTGSDDSMFKATLAAQDGTLYATLRSAQMIIILR